MNKNLERARQRPRLKESELKLQCRLREPEAAVKEAQAKAINMDR